MVLVWFWFNWFWLVLVGDGSGPAPFRGSKVTMLHGHGSLSKCGSCPKSVIGVEGLSIQGVPVRGVLRRTLMRHPSGAWRSEEGPRGFAEDADASSFRGM